MCCNKYQTKRTIDRLLHGIFHIVPGISPRLPYQDQTGELMPGENGKYHVIICYFLAKEMIIHVLMLKNIRSIFLH